MDQITLIAVMTLLYYTIIFAFFCVSLRFTSCEVKARYPYLVSNQEGILKSLGFFSESRHPDLVVSQICMTENTNEPDAEIDASRYRELFGGPEPYPPTSYRLNPHEISFSNLLRQAGVDQIVYPYILLISRRLEAQVLCESTFNFRCHLKIETDGLSGVAAALRQKPDLIILDCKSPMVDSSECLDLFKGENFTSDIPVLLIDDHSYFALKNRNVFPNGIVELPMSEKELLVTCSIFLQSNLIQRNHQDRPWIGPLSSDEMVLLGKIIEGIRLHYQDPTFGVQELADEVAISRRHLHRRLCEIIGMTPSQLLRTARLQQAILRLSMGKGNISEICYSVGFKNPSYFSRQFRNTLGMTPQQVADSVSPKNLGLYIIDSNQKSRKYQ